jgi:tetratricopeptide (TPR) repeat protein
VKADRGRAKSRDQPPNLSLNPDALQVMLRAVRSARYLCSSGFDVNRVDLRSLVPALFALLSACDSVTDAGSYCINGEQAVRSSQYPGAIDLLSKCLEQSRLDADERARTLKLRAWAYQSLRQDLQAVADEEAAFHLDPRFEYRDYINLAMYLRRVGRFEESLQAVHSAEEMQEPQDHPAMMTQYHLGWTLSALGRYDEAVQAFTRGIPDQPDYPFVYWRRGLAYEALKQPENARADFDRFAEKLSASDAERFASRDMLPEIHEKLKQYGLDGKYSL